jgi:hypothetical protein
MTDWGFTNQVRGSSLHRSDQSDQGPGHSCSPRQEYRVKEKKEEVQHMQIDSGKAVAEDVVQIGDVNMAIKE